MPSNFISESSPNGGKLQHSVLIVDDHSDSLSYAQQAVEIFGYRAVTLSEGKPALETALAHTPTVILLDICLKDIDGFEVIEQLKQDERTANIPVIAATARVDAQTRKKAFAYGFDSFLEKPYTLEALENELSRYVAKSSLSAFQMPVPAITDCVA